MSDKKWLLVVLVLSGVFLFLFARFAVDAQAIKGLVRHLHGEEESGKRPFHVILIEQQQDHPYWKMVEQGALDAAKLYGMSLEYHGPIRNSMEDQIELLDKAIAAKVDGIIVQGLNDNKFTPVINKAVDLGIPVLTVDTDSPTSKRLTYVGTDNFEAGKRLGHKVVQATGASATIGVIIGSDTAESQLLRLEGLKSVVERFPDMQIVVVGVSDISRMEAIVQAEMMLRDYPQINTMVGTSALDAVGILQARENLGRNDVAIFGFDDMTDTMQSISKGDIVATLVQNPYLMGYDSVRLLNDYYMGRELPKEHFTKIEVIDRDNVQTGVKTP
ncbi:sugar-binding protein [Paenibacillus turpanensis]|uniref:sugar-binding protein n=1 Tax=Paenibacillus turpanensis TaxID=2689078 RepID=UPI00140A91A8|nr:sugar-binding protein [Paenibacillus turpanensis]